MTIDNANANMSVLQSDQTSKTKGRELLRRG